MALKGTLALCEKIMLFLNKNTKSIKVYITFTLDDVGCVSVC